MSKFYFDAAQRFVIEDYNKTKPFASFLPGIAGVSGIPMWVYYVNRGQGIASFGVENKNGCIMEFLPADKSYYTVPTKGFRTFIRLEENGGSKIVEPFSGASFHHPKEIMAFSQNKLEFSSNDETHGLDIQVSYFTLPNENMAALVRKVTIKNTARNQRQLEVLDGLPAILPYGIDDMLYKSLGNTIKSWMDVFNLDHDVPYYRVRASIVDSSEVSEISAGHFYLSFLPESPGKALRPVVDADLIFGENTSFSHPNRFAELGLEQIQREDQVTVNKVPCGFTGLKRILNANDAFSFYTIIGHVSDINLVNSSLTRLADADFIENKMAQAEKLVQDLTDNVATSTGSNMFDGYARQCYLDNVLRGGYPLILENGKEPFVYHVFSRKHGDLERDYNFFSLAAEFYSQGNGNFRDANQNRRNDVLFDTRVKDFNVKMFMNLIQTDGYNPLVVKGCAFILSQDSMSSILPLFESSSHERIASFFKKPFTPGKFIKYIMDNQITLLKSPDEVLKEILHYATQNIEADFGEGYWCDHWTYNMDLIDTYLTVYPEKKLDMLFGEKDYLYYDNYVFVAPRQDKYVFVNGKVRQYDAVIEDEHKKEFIHKRASMPFWVRTEHGKGEIYRTTLFEKLLTLALTKFTSLDPLGMGVEMEGDKPGWDDSMNGLPGLFGSSMPETYELKRILVFLSDIGAYDRTIALPEEIHELLMTTYACLKAYQADTSPNRDYRYWDAVYAAKEAYREKTRYGLSGSLKEITMNDLNQMINQFSAKLDEGIKRADEFGKGISPTYFTFEAVEYDFIKDENQSIKTNHKGRQNVMVKAFKPHMINYFLEGVVKALKVTQDAQRAEEIFNNVRNSDIYDRKLKMYKICAPLKEESVEIGRAKAFTPGWLENESIFTHMEYKYVLEVLKAGLYDAFFEDMRNLLVPFLDPRVYGRSTLENSSFIASSANPDPSTHGRGFVARLSGSTAEFLSMWFIMMAGKKPFRLHNGELQLELSPILPSWLFDEKGEVAFKFLGTCDVTYKNPGKKNTYGREGAKIKKMDITLRNGEMAQITGSIIPPFLAERMRSGQGKSVTCYLD